ncbi:TetR/AcrR family transcriptional regulator [Saccharopolyspora taberi]|uniref:TetR/AcrR family transcriptional regulator n=1 Tax=Saccharopolyspora taberi TaxID=60895 RepID=A0ABN3VEB9_9PSEU
MTSFDDEFLADDDFLARVRAMPEPDDDSVRRVLDAGLSCFADHGIRRTTMNRIAERAGLGVATVYRRFPRKDQLVQAVLLREVRRFVTAVDSRVAAARTPEEQMTESFTAFVAGVARNPLLLRVLAAEPETALPLLTARGGPVLALGRSYVADNIRRWQRDGAVTGFDADLVAEIFARLAHSLVLTPGGLIPTEDDETTREFARTHLLPLLSPKKS